MSKFITGKELSEAVDTIIWKAKDELLIVSPYIKLDDHFKELFEKQRHNHELHIQLMFGKNEGRVDKSFNKADLEYFKQFPNISIVYVPKLHAKYYANEKMGVVTSINLYDFSFNNNNIEFGVLYENKLLNRLSLNTDSEVWNTCKDIADENPVIYVNRPMYADYDFRGSKVLYDITEELYNGRLITKGTKKLDDYEAELDFDEVYSEMPTRNQVESREKLEKKGNFAYQAPKSALSQHFEPGYCIRTGEKIPFNIKSPLSRQAYKSWSKYENKEYPEKYCHYSGEPSNGETCFNRPVMRKNFRKSPQA